MDNNNILENNEMQDLEAAMTDIKGIGGKAPYIVAGVLGAGALVGGGIALCKKFGGKAVAKANDVRESRILKKQEKLAAKYIKIQEKKNEVVQEEPEKK